MPTALICRIAGKLLMGWLLLFTVTAFADENNSPWYTHAWQSGDGLPDNSVSGVAQTPDGYLWVATAGGLMRFDGVRFQEYPLSSLEGVPNRVVRTMLLDRHGCLWLGMDRGPVVCIAPGTTQVFTNDMPDARMVSMAEDAQGAVWIAYGDGELVRIKDKQVKNFDATDGWPTQGDPSLASDIQGRLWFAKGNQVGIFRDGRLRTLLTLPETVGCIAKRREGGIWINTERRLLYYKMGGQPKLFDQLPPKANGIEANTLLEDRTGKLWVGTAANGLFCCTATNVTQVPTSYYEIACLAEDHEGNIWVGTGGGGVDRIRPRVLELLGPETGLPYESIRSCCEDISGNVWVATQNGLLACWRHHKWITHFEGTNVPVGDFSCVEPDPKGGLWVGTRDHGFYHWQDGKCRNWRQADGLSSDDVRSILESSNGDVYIATDTPSRLQRLRNGKLQELQSSIQPRSLRALAEDSAGNIWVASADGLLLRVQGDQLLNETPGVTNRLLSIRCLCPTPNGGLWIGYAGWGIGWLRNGHFSRVTMGQGLYDDYISQIVEDDRGWLWCASNRGIFEVQLHQLKAVADGQQDHLRSIAFGKSEGIPNLQPNYENYPGAFRNQNDQLWFPMRTGLAVVHANRVPNNAPPPPVLLEQVTVDGKTVALYDKYLPFNSGRQMTLVNLKTSGAVLRLPPNHRKIDFDYTALSFTAPEDIEFQYRLQGFDDNWMEAGTARSATYSRLPPGKYRFQVRACNLAGIWSQGNASLNFVVEPFYWQTAWFRLVTLAVFTLVIVGIVRYVSFRRLHRQLRLLEQQAALQRERARIAKDIHDDLGANLTQIAFLGELARQDRDEPEKAAERIVTISSTARQAIKSLDEIVWAVNPRNDTLAHLIDYAGQFALDYLRLAEIRCRLDFPEQNPPRELSTDLRHNLFLTIKEALHNTVKHAHATEVWLRIAFSEQALNIIIEDNGCGFTQEPDDALADGLRNMRQRMSDIGGECRVESQAGSGTKITLYLPWPGN